MEKIFFYSFFILLLHTFLTYICWYLLLEFLTFDIIKISYDYTRHEYYPKSN
jgi:hypothetical protein